jgi:hypothetical protein
MNRLATAPWEKRELHIDNAAHDKRKYVGCKLQDMCRDAQTEGSTPSATRGCQTSRLGLVRASTQLVSITYNSAPGKVILDQSVKALPVRCSAYVTGQLQHARCGRKSVATAEEALVTSLERGKSRFPQLGVWVNRRKL